MSLCDFVKSGITVEVDNGQARLISGIDFLQGYSGTYQAIHFGKCGQNVLEVAKNNLDNHFDLVGILEKFGQSLYLLRHFYGWRKSFYRTKNVTKGRKQRNKISRKDIETIIEYNKLDIELYDYAKNLFERKKRKTDIPLFNITLFEYFNFVYNKIIQARENSLSKLRSYASH